MTTEIRYFASPRGAHDAALDLYAIAKEKTRRGAAYLLKLVSFNKTRRHQLRKGFHGPVLRAISEQVWVLHPTIQGRQVRYSKAAWKEFFRDVFIPPEPEEYTVKKTGEVKVRMVERSTEDLDDDEFAQFLLQVEAYAATELGVIFEDDEETP